MAEPNNTEGAPPREVHIEPKKTNWLAWIALGLGILALIWWLASHNRQNTVPVTTVTENTTTATPPVAVEQVTLPGGKQINLMPATLNYELQRYLASNDPAPKTFTFDKLNFDTAKADIRPDDTSTVDALGQILTAYPKAIVTLTGYTDARGGAGTNAKLGEQRAMAVADALKKAGIAANRITTKSGGEDKPIATNTTANGEFENRRTELTVTAK